MKTLKFRLLATMITLAAVITATSFPANAQRRSTQDTEKNKKVETNNSERRNNIEKKSSIKDNAIEPRANNRSVSSSREVKRHNSPAKNNVQRERRTSSGSGENRIEKSSVQNSTSDFNQNRNDAREINRERDKKENKTKTANEKVWVNKSELPRRSTGYSNSDRRNNENDEKVYNSARASGNYKERYNHNEDDVRYKPNRDYRGSDKYWSPELRGDKYAKKRYNWHNYNHWDRNWETYRWNNNSWQNYYGFYDPYSYRHHKHYYHHHYYGHVIRRFVYRPQIYIHNHTKYYCYDGFFFRYRSGVGYVLVDIPFGFTFEYLPDDYERVYINGFMYFRVGNLFFENTEFGFRLVHYPERYFSYKDGYSNEGFWFNDMNY